MLLRVEFFLVGLSVDEKFTVLPVRDALLLEEGFYFGQIRRVTGHIGGQNDPYKPLSESLEVISGEFLEKVILLAIEQKKGLSCVIVLLYALVTVADGAF